MCHSLGRITPAAHVDHIIPHRGDHNLFHDINNTQSLCLLCHNMHKQRIEIHGYDQTIGSDGYPIDSRHPFNSGVTGGRGGSNR
jgi:5-methylcytosine-specific restriction protein A